MVFAALVDDQLDEGVVDAAGMVKGPAEVGCDGALYLADEFCWFWPVLLGFGAPERGGE
jgi:hypothetical protein